MRRVSSPTFVGRAEQLAAFDSALARAAGGRPGVLLLAGESGVGKTRLVGELARRALERDARVLTGDCVELGEGELPYAPLAAALREVGLTLPLDSDEVADLERFSQSRLFERLLALLAELSDERPLVLVVEDLHWADRSTRDFLAFLSRALRQERLLLVVTYRSDELHRRHPLRPLLAELERLERVERLDLTRFSRGELVAQLTGILGARPDARLVEELWERAEGNAFFTEELLAAGETADARALPETLRDALMVRVERLPEGAQRVVRVAAASGRGVSHPLLGEVAGLEGSELLGSVREAVGQHVLVQRDGQGYGFRHALIREAVYDDLLPGERGELHLRLAEALARDPSLSAEVTGAQAELAWHWRQAHDLPRALRASVAAAADARRLQAPAEAARHLDGALELWDRVDGAAELAGAELVDLLLLAADAHQLAGDHDRALRLGRRALGLVDAALDPVAAGLIHERLGRFLWLGGRDRDALEEYRAAVRILPGEPSSARARVLAAEAQILILIGRFEQSRPIAEQARDTARSVEDSAVKAHALATLGTDLVGLDRRRDGIELLERALAVQSELAVPDDRLRTYTNLSDAYDQAGRLDDAVRLAQEGREAARGYGMVRYGSFMCAEIAWRHVRLGRLEEARRLIEEALDLTPTGIAATLVHEVAARLAIALGDVGRAEAHATEAARSTEMAMGSQFVAPVYTALVELARLRRDVGQVRALIARARELMAGGREDPFFCTQLFLAALAAEADAAERCRALGDGSGEAEAVESGRALGARVMELAATPDPTPHAASDALMARAELSRLARKDDPEPWRGAAAAYERLGYVLRAAEARMRLAETLLAVGVRGGAQDELRAAHATAERCGAIALRDEVAALARRARLELAGDGPGRSNGEAPLGLTERELEVLRLVAEGCTNRQIGEELFMSEKTASVHVSRILAKLEVRSRGEAGAVAHRLGLSAS